MIGRTLEQYRIESKLGEGGMGVVYKAYDSRLNRPVALKVLRPESVADAAAGDRFLQEARAASALNHPAIVTIHDIRSTDGVDFIVMEYVEGRTLDTVIRQGGLSLDLAMRYALQIADALSKAHEAGILHRDLKPSNVMITRDRRVKLLDFGLAKLLEPSSSAGDAETIAAPLTAERMVVGTAAYMSPEQAEGRKLDARSDIFSFGAVLYEMATGQQAFTGGSWLTLLAAIVRDDPPAPRAAAPAMSPELERLIMRCLRKDPARRYQTMADLKVALEDVEGETTAARVTAPARRRTGSIAVVVVLLAVIAAYFGWRWLRPAPPSVPLRADALTTFPGKELYPSLSPDGNYVAFTWSGAKQDSTDVYVQQIGVGSPLRLTSDPRNDYNPVWSPDGRSIAFLRGDAATPLARSQRELRLIPPLGGTERVLGEISVQEITDNPVYLAWCPDSSCLIVTDTTGAGKPDALFIVSIETGAKQPLTDPPAPAVADTNPAISPDGRSVLFMRRATWALGELRVAPFRKALVESETRPMALPGLNPDTPTWLNAGEILISTPVFAGGAALWRVAVSGAMQPARLPFVGEDGIMPAVFAGQDTRPSRLVYVRSFTDENIWRIAVQDDPASTSAAAAVVIASTKSDLHPQLSPDGRRVAFTSTRSGPWQIWVSDLDGSNALQLTSLRTATGTGAPTWSPDGQWLVFASDAEGQFDIFLVPAAGGKPRNITTHPAFDHVPVFSHDGKSIYFSSTRTGSAQVWKVAVDGGDPVQVTRDGGWLPREAPDGSALYFTKTPAIGASTALWRMEASGGSPSKVLDGMLNAPIAIGKQGIYYLQRSPGATVQFYDFATRRSTIVARGPGEAVTIGGFSASPDGRILLYARLDSAVDDLMLVENFR